MIQISTKNILHNILHIFKYKLTTECWKHPLKCPISARHFSMLIGIIPNLTLQMPSRYSKYQLMEVVPFSLYKEQKSIEGQLRHRNIQ